MRTSLNDIKQTEQYLQGQLTAEDALVVEAKLLTNPLFKLNILAQKKLYQLVKFYHYKKLKKEASATSQKLFNDSDKEDFQKEITKIFN